MLYATRGGGSDWSDVRLPLIVPLPDLAATEALAPAPGVAGAAGRLHPAGGAAGRRQDRAGPGVPARRGGRSGDGGAEPVLHPGADLRHENWSGVPLRSVATGWARFAGRTGLGGRAGRASSWWNGPTGSARCGRKDALTITLRAGRGRGAGSDVGGLGRSAVASRHEPRRHDRGLPRPQRFSHRATPNRWRRMPASGATCGSGAIGPPC